MERITFFLPKSWFDTSTTNPYSIYVNYTSCIEAIPPEIKDPSDSLSRVTMRYELSESQTLHDLNENLQKTHIRQSVIHICVPTNILAAHFYRGSGICVRDHWWNSCPTLWDGNTIQVSLLTPSHLLRESWRSCFSNRMKGPGCSAPSSPKAYREVQVLQQGVAQYSPLDAGRRGSFEESDFYCFCSAIRHYSKMLQNIND